MDGERISPPCPVPPGAGTGRGDPCLSPWLLSLFPADPTLVYPGGVSRKGFETSLAPEAAAAAWGEGEEEGRGYASEHQGEGGGFLLALRTWKKKSPEGPRV